MRNRRSRAARRSNGEEISLNITPFMNLMVVLIPFLLSGVVFSRLAILEMKLPTNDGSTAVAKVKKEPFRLVITLREKGLTVLGTGIGRVKFKKKDKTHDLEGLTKLLVKLKAKHPNEKSLILLNEPDIEYETLIAVMDRCRETEEHILFPDISIGGVKAA